MKYAIISDIHSNLEALEVVFEEIDRLGLDKTICLGDIVGYGANPNECVEIIRERKVESLLGNHDIVACGKKEPYDFNTAARDSALWTRSVLTAGNKGFLYSLPDKKEIEDFLIVHGAISDPDLYILSAYDAFSEFNLMKKYYICFFGHTHMRVWYAFQSGDLRHISDYEFKIEPKSKYLINPGSVGQPRDRDPRSSFLIYDWEEGVVKNIRLKYDIGLAQKKIIEAGLDRRLAERLSLGI
jgi:diadenosine tetraphosphatase ApaH/serine/threonine PP2A family protein phosphatase